MERFKQPMITNLFKTRKQNFRQSIKKIKEESVDNNHDFILSEEYLGANKRIKLDNLNSSKGALKLKDNNKELSSKSTIATLGSKTSFNISSPNKKDNEDNNQNSFKLSSKTKNILQEILNKKVNQNNKNKSSLFEENLGVKKVSFSNRFSVSNKEENYNKKNEVPTLSDNAKKIIEKLKKERKNKFLRENNEKRHFKPSDNSLSSLRLKYEELIKDDRELPLPLSYKKIYNSFNSLENMINLNKLKSQSNLCSFDNLKLSIESSTHKKFDMKVFQQILYIVPHFYIYKYQKKKNDDESVFNLNIKDYNKSDYDLIIDIPKDFEERQSKNYEDNFNFTTINFIGKDQEFIPIYKPLTNKQSNLRKKLFKNILNRIVNDFHSKFIEKNNIKLKFDPLKSKTWHHDFDYEKECEEIPLYEIPDTPEKNCSLFERTIIKNDIKSQILKDALSMVNESDDKEENENIKQKDNKILSKYISSDLLLKLRKKEEAIKISNEIYNYNLSINNKKDLSKIYREIILQTKAFLMINKKSYGLKELSEKIWNCKRIIKDAFSSKEEVADIIYKLCNKYSDIIKVIKHSLLGYIVVLQNNNKEIPNEIQI